MSVTTKKIRLVPVGDKEEVNRIYEYIHNGQYNQYQIMNALMAQICAAFYNNGRDLKNENFKNEYKRILRVENYIWKEYSLPKGLGSQASIGQKLRSDFSTAIKNGFARGDRSLPFYKRTNPLLIPGALISLNKGEDNYTNESGELIERESFFIKLPNKIVMKVVLGSKGERDSSLVTVLNGLSDPNDQTYSIGGSSIGIYDKKIILNLSVKTDKESDYKPVEGRVMSLAFGYTRPMTAHISDTDKIIKIGDNLSEEIVNRRLKTQYKFHCVQSALKTARGGRGRAKKLKALENFKKYEKNIVKTFNHKMSLAVIEAAIKNKVEVIRMEPISIGDFYENPTMLRNWSYYQLVQFIIYKAKIHGIKVVEVSEKEMPDILSVCSNCGESNEKELEIPKEFSWSTDIHYCCEYCKKSIPFSDNKARNISNIK